MTNSKVKPSVSKRKKKRKKSKSPTGNMDMRSFNEDERSLIRVMVNRYGDSGVHMRKENAKFFKKKFVKKTVSINKHKLTKKGQKVANKVIRKIK